MSIILRYKVNFGQPGRRRRPTLIRPADDVPAGDGAIPAAVTPTAKCLALAHRVDLALQRGEVASYADIARRRGTSPSHMNDVAMLTLLAPDIQEAILDGRLLLSEYALRPIALMASWEAQRRAVESATMPSAASANRWA